MNQFKSRRIRAQKTSFAARKEEVFQVDEPSAYVAPGQTVEILISGQTGFSVYIPYAGIFNAQVFEAEENPAWALTQNEAAAGGSMDGQTGSAIEKTKEKVWGVRMTRIIKKNQSPIKEMPYCIYSHELQNFAVGNSPPRMGLEP